MTVRRPLLALASLLLVTAGLVGCGDDDGDDAGGGGGTTTTEATDGDGGTTASSDATDTTEGSTTETSTDDEPTTAGGSTTSPNLPPNDSPLVDLLLDPATLGPDFVADDSLGDGSFDTDLCEEISLEATWDDQAAQALLAGTGDDAVIFQQAILRFPDEAAAEAFTTEVGDALVACQPGTEITPVEGVGDEAFLGASPSAEFTTAAGLVRVGDLVTTLLGLTAPNVPAPVDEPTLAAAAGLLAG